MTDVVEATCDIGVQHIFVLVLDTAEDCRNRIMTQRPGRNP